MRWMILLAAVATLSACVPVRVSSRCQKIGSDCLAQCPDTQMPLQNDRVLGTGFDSDSRNACQKACHDVTSSCESGK